MKSAKDPRHKARQQAVKNLFSVSFTDQKINKLAKKVMSKKKKIDKLIIESAPAWPIEKINKIDLAILRLAVYELTSTDTPSKVVIDEAVELAKEFSNETSPAFVNGVLGDIIKKNG